MSDGPFITVPARTREEIGALSYFLEHGLRNLRTITEHLRGSSGTVPSVLDELRDVVRMTETATVRVLDETEALVDDGRAAARLLTDVQAKAATGDAQALEAPMRELRSLVERSNARAMEIMSALEFQDVTCQKVERMFAVLGEVLVRLGKIQRLVDTRGGLTGPAPPAHRRIALDGAAGQRLADELMLQFTGQPNL